MNFSNTLQTRKKSFFLNEYLHRDLLRAAVQSKTERGEQLNALMTAGKLVPMEVVLDLLKENMIKNA
ncbi:unnamed protein product, partial [Rotaria sordida]